MEGDPIKGELMKIATMVRGYIAAPRPKDIVYAPIDLAVAISEQLTKRGHEVTFFAPAGSHLHATVETHGLAPLIQNRAEFDELLHNVDLMAHSMPALREHYYALDMFQRARAGEFDALHFHHPEVALPYARLFPYVPVIYTLHDPISDWYKDMFQLHSSPNQHFISISDNQRRSAPDLPYAATVYNGTDIDAFTLEKEHDEYLLFVGRIVPEKGIKEAVEIAQATDHRLLIIGPTYNDNREAFDRFVKPHLNEKILYLGFLEQQEVIRYYQKAKALLMPIQWEEPFGLTMIEAMACGTPVIAFDRGSVSEVVEHEKTGFVVHTLAEAIEAVGRTHEIDPLACRQHVIDRFSITTMVDAYEAAIEAVIGGKLTPADRLRKVIRKVRKPSLLSR